MYKRKFNSVSKTNCYRPVSGKEVILKTSLKSEYNLIISNLIIRKQIRHLTTPEQIILKFVKELNDTFWKQIRFTFISLSMLFCDFCLDLWTISTLWSSTMHNLKEFLKSNMLQDHIWNVHCSREHVCYVLLEQYAFHIWSWSIFM